MTGTSARRALVLVIGVSAITLAIVWSQRKPIARDYIDRELTRRGVPAVYTIAAIGPRWQRLEQVRLGNPQSPDLTADWVEVRLSPGFSGVSVTELRAGGVRLNGRLASGKVSFGSVDRLLPAGNGEPFRLPAINVDLTDTRLHLNSVHGSIDARLDGKGPLASGFRGRLATRSDILRIAKCDARAVHGGLGIRTSVGRAELAGPLDFGRVACGQVDSSGGRLVVNAFFSPSFTSGSGRLTLLAPHLNYRGHSATGATFDGRYEFGDRIRLDGRLDVQSLSFDRRSLAPLERAAVQTRDTPVGPLLSQLGRSVSGLGRVALQADIVARDTNALSLSDLAISATNGAALKQVGGGGLRLGASSSANIAVRLTGGGLPTADGQIHWAAGKLRMLVRAEPYMAGRARLVLSPVRIVANGTGTMRIEMEAELDGPLGNGSITGLRAPLTLQSDKTSITINAGCTPVTLRALHVSGLMLNPLALRICPSGVGLVHVRGNHVSGGGIIRSPRLTGHVGTTPLALAATSTGLSLADTGFAIENLHAAIGSPSRVTTIDVGVLRGHLNGPTLRGSFSRSGGRIASVPLVISDAQGNWTLDVGVLSLDASTLQLADAAVPPRFNPLAGRGVRLTLKDNRISMRGLLVEPATGTQVVAVTLGHDLRTGVGRAHLDVPQLTFGKALQPEALTRLTLGVVANVRGSVNGDGDIRWGPAGVQSTGSFATEGLDLAAAFGPVAGLKGRIEFSDLLGLVTRPDQTVTIASINPGLPVIDGRITYRLLAGQNIAVEGGRWPFAGGELLLDPTVLDMGRPSERRLTFRVVGLDAAKFIQQLEFENLAATGRFDGALPMVFDASGGRIADGHLVARAGGGTIAYVGEVSNAKMNMFAKLAFDALKSIRYNNLTIDLDGPLDGEIVSQVRFTGINGEAVTPPKGMLAKAFTGLPFRFNITIKAPFRGLLTTARTFQDPSQLLHGIAKPVQPPESAK